ARFAIPVFEFGGAAGRSIHTDYGANTLFAAILGVGLRARRIARSIVEPSLHDRHIARGIAQVAFKAMKAGHVPHWVGLCVYAQVNVNGAARSLQGECYPLECLGFHHVFTWGSFVAAIDHPVTE